MIAKAIPVIVIIITAVLALLVAGQFYISNDDFCKWNPYWNGMSRFYEGTDQKFISHLSDLPSANAAGTTLLIISPLYSYGHSDSAAIESYLERGGNLVVIDDFGESDSLLASLNTSIRLRDVALCQNDNYYNSPSLPIIVNVSGTGLTTGIGQIYTNHPACLSVGEQDVILASTNRRGWLDYDNDGLFNTEENFSAYPVIASESYGPGSVTVISDPDIFINSIIDKGDNRRLASALLNGRTIYVDISHGPGMPPLISAINTIMHSVLAQVLCIISASFAIILSYYFLRRSSRSDDDEGTANDMPAVLAAPNTGRKSGMRRAAEDDDEQK